MDIASKYSLVTCALPESQFYILNSSSLSIFFIIRIYLLSDFSNSNLLSE